MHGFVGEDALMDMVAEVGGELYRMTSECRYTYALHLEREKRLPAMARWLKEIAWFEPVERKPDKIAYMQFQVLKLELRRSNQKQAYYLKRERGRHEYQFGRQKREYKPVNCVFHVK